MPLVAIACYLNSLGGGFVFDDSSAIVKNMMLRPQTPITEVFRHDYWGTRLSSPKSHKGYRPLTVLTFRMNYALAGLEPFGYHLGNVLAHAAVCYVLLFVGRFILGSVGAAALAALLFAAHPVHTEPVASVVGRQEMLCSIFFLAAFLAFTKAARTAKTEWRWFAGAVALYFAAALTKETGVTVLGVMFMYDLLLVPREGDGLAKWRPFLIRQAILVVFGLAFVVGRQIMTVQLGASFSFVDNPIHFSERLLPKVLTYAYLHARYAWLLIFPLTLSADYSYNAIPLITSFADPRNLATLCLYVGLLLLAWVVWRSRDREMLAFASAWFVLPFLPVSNLFFSVALVIAERQLYIPSIGFCLLLGYVLSGLGRKGLWGKRAQIAVTSVLLTFYVGRTVTRNPDWATPESIFTSARRVCPTSAKMHLCIGVLRGKEARDCREPAKRQKLLDEAVESFGEAVKILPEYDEAYFCLGMAYQDLGRLGEAEKQYLKALEHREKHAGALSQLASILAARHQAGQAGSDKLNKAEEHCRASLRSDPQNANAHNTFANILVLQSNLARDQNRREVWRAKLKEAFGHYRDSMRLDPDKPDPRRNLAQTLNSFAAELVRQSRIDRKLGRLEQAKAKGEEAIRHYRESARLIPSSPDTHHNLAVALAGEKRHDEAIEEYRKAIAVKPSFGRALLNLGTVLCEKGDLGAAADAFRRAAAIPEVAQKAKANLAALARAGQGPQKARDR